MVDLIDFGPKIPSLQLKLLRISDYKHVLQSIFLILFKRISATYAFTNSGNILAAVCWFQKSDHHVRLLILSWSFVLIHGGHIAAVEFPQEDLNSSQFPLRSGKIQMILFHLWIKMLPFQSVVPRVRGR